MGFPPIPGWRRVSSGCCVVLHCAASTAALCPGRGSGSPLQNDHDGILPRQIFWRRTVPVYAPFPSTPEASRLRCCRVDVKSSVPRNSGSINCWPAWKTWAASCRTCSSWLTSCGPSFGADGGAKAQDGRARREMLVFLHQRLQRKGFDGCATESDARNFAKPVAIERPRG